jgi:hypothetical protein
LDDRGGLRRRTGGLAWVTARLVEDLPAGPTAPCPACHGHRWVTPGQHRPCRSALAAERAAGRGKARTCVYCDGSGLAGWVALWESCDDCKATGRALGWADVVDPVVPEEVDLDQPASEAFLAAWLAAATWTVARTDPPRPRSIEAKLYRSSDRWAEVQLVGYGAASSLVSVWAPGAGWEATPDATLVDCAQALVAARRHPLALSQLSAGSGRRLATGLRVEVIGGYGWRVTVADAPAPPGGRRRRGRRWRCRRRRSPAGPLWTRPPGNCWRPCTARTRSASTPSTPTAATTSAPGPPAATWRWIDLDPAALTAPPEPGAAAKHGADAKQLAALLADTPESQLEQRLAALAGRRLVDRRGGPGCAEAQLTRLGRQAVRAGLRERPRGRAPAHLLRYWAWQLLAELYDADEGGVHPAPYTGRVGGDALSDLRHHVDGPLVEDISVPQPVGQPARRAAHHHGRAGLLRAHLGRARPLAPGRAGESTARRRGRHPPAACRRTTHVTTHARVPATRRRSPGHPKRLA